MRCSSREPAFTMSVNERSLPRAARPPLCYQSCASGSGLPLPSSPRSLGSWRQTPAERWFSDLCACVCRVLCLGLPVGSVAWAGRPEGPQRGGRPLLQVQACVLRPPEALSSDAAGLRERPAPRRRPRLLLLPGCPKGWFWRGRPRLERPAFNMPSL